MSRRVASVIVLGAVLGLMPACASHRAASTAEPAAPATFNNLGGHTWPVTTSSAEAQRYFDQGVVWMYSFNHDEAIRNYTQVTRLDPSCAMAWWGIALASGPHINNPFMDEQHSRAAWAAWTKADELSGTCTPVEKALIAALRNRYVDPAAAGEEGLPLDPVGRAPLDKAYADAMADVHARFPDDPEVGTLYAESLMDLRPWDLWSLSGEPRPETPLVLATLEGVLAAHPEHPGANHLYIHAVEASREPQRAEASAKRLRTLVPASGHMVHMPAHIDVRMGRWNTAAEQNELAIKSHGEYQKRSPRQGFYRVYMLHNDHFLAYACMMAGRRADAIAASRQMLASIPEDFFRDFAPVADAYTSIEIESLMRFGEWDAILAMDEPREELPITRTMWRFARGVSYAAKGQASLAREEQRLFRQQKDALPEGAMMAINPAKKVLTIADEMLEGEIAYREGDVDAAVEHLSAAVEVEDTLMYMEPPDWPQPVRHTLGAVLLDAGRHEAAAAVYREDLKRWPENGWSLYGLSRSLEGMGRAEEAAACRRRYEEAFDRADVDLGASCACVKGAKKKG